MDDAERRRTLHELNNQFQVIVGCLELLRRSRELSPEAVETALRAAEQAAAIAQRLLGEPPSGAPGAPPQGPRRR